MVDVGGLEVSLHYFVRKMNIKNTLLKNTACTYGEINYMLL